MFYIQTTEVYDDTNTQKRVVRTSINQLLTRGEQNMKRINQLLATLVIVAAPFAVVNVVAADTCEIGYTGPDSSNKCTTEVTYACEIVNENIVIVDNGNTQIAISGDSDDSGNNTGGDSQSGTATNSNGTVFDIVVTNNDEEGNVCVLTTTVPATPTPTTQKTETVVKPKEAVKPTVLANTAGDNTVTVLLTLGAVALLVAAGTVAVTRFAKR